MLFTLNFFLAAGGEGLAVGNYLTNNVDKVSTFFNCDRVIQPPYGPPSTSDILRPVVCHLLEESGNM